MDCINPSFPKQSHFPPQTSLFPQNPFSPTQFRRNPSRNHRFHQPFPLRIPPFTFSISAHSGGPSKRRNSLRKKLTEEQKGILIHTTHKGLITEPPVYNSDEIEAFENKHNLGNLDKNSESSASVEKPKHSRGSSSWARFESWVDQYKDDVEFWGIGSGPVFTVFRDGEGKVERVSVDEDEILRRSRIEPVEANSKIAHARRIAGEVENGVYEFPKNSSVAKFVVLGEESEAGVVGRIRSVVVRPEMLLKLPKISFVIVCSLFVLSSVRRIFVVKDEEGKLTREEKEMLRRKVRVRMEREKMESERVEVLPKVDETIGGARVRPRLDKEELMSSIAKLKEPGEELMLADSSSSLDVGTYETRKFNDKVLEIQEMARRARELERESREEAKDVDKGISSETMNKELHVHDSHEPVDVDSTDPMHISATDKFSYVDDINASKMRETMDVKDVIESCDSPTTEPVHADDLNGASVHSLQNTNSQISISPTNDEGSKNVMKSWYDQNARDSNIVHPMEMKELQPFSVPDEKTDKSDKSPNSIKPKIILTVKEAKEYLSQKRNKGELDNEPKIEKVALGPAILESSIEEEVQVKGDQVTHDARELYESSVADEILDTKSDLNDYQNSAQMESNSDGDLMPSVPLKTNNFDSVEKNYETDDFEKMGTSEKYEEGEYSKEATPVVFKESWVEKNFHELEPIIKKIGEGYTKNYAVAKERAHEELNLRSEVTLPEYGDSELDWMNDDSLREIVFRVRENELLGHDPFHMMDAEDKLTFFKGLEKKAEKESEQLLKLHEYLHSRIENLDYGADGISVHDSPKKIIPRWKGPTIDKDPEFLNKPVNRPSGMFDQNTDVSPMVNGSSRETLQKSTDSTVSEDVLPSTRNYISREAPQGKTSKSPKTVIESSDGSVRAGKKSGKEFWQHTKKWSREFLELYNSEEDPEVKSIMKDMGKDLDRWITEKEIQETAELMDSIPQKKREYIEKKIGKLKREMEMFGPQAVVSKYREYGEAEEEDYLWWLDLPYVLCIELYTTEEGEEKVGFYSLEMAEDLELDPKQYHVIAFEDPGDSKSFCYIMHAHLEMLGTGSAFVVARPPKDAFREAKANGFSVTVIRKGELPLNIDQTLEEVEEQIAEIGSKVYHDKMTRERGVDMGALMKGVFGSNKPTKRRKPKRKTKKLPATEE